jgi:hypothetical protein
MKRLKGPELKMPELKVPAFAGDLYYDLRERRLLPLLALVVVAIAAVPFLLGDSEEAAPPIAGTEAAPEELEGATLAVVRAEPGLRDYRKRLRGRTPTDPFKPHLTSPVLSGTKLPQPPGGSGGEGQSSSSSDSPSSAGSAPAPDTGSSGGGAPAGAGGDSEGGGGDAGKKNGDATEPGKAPDMTVLAWSIDVSIVRSGGATDAARKKSAAAKPYTKKSVLPQTVLPGEKAPAVMYLGPVREGTGVVGKALFLVSRDVVSVFGDVSCAEGDEVCQLVEVEPGLPVSFVYGPEEVTYTLTVRSINPVESTAAAK